MLKIQLEQKIVELETQLEEEKKESSEWESINYDRRKLFSRIFGKYSESHYPSADREVLEWSQIFFELGKLYQRANDDRTQIDMANDIKFLLDCEHQRAKKMEEDMREEGLK